MKTLLILGFKFTNNHTLILEDLDKDFYTLVMFFRRNPFTLRDLTRRAILIDLNISSKLNIEKLPLPSVLKRFLLLQDINSE